METNEVLDLKVIKANMIRHIQGINKHLTPEYLEQFKARELLGECHPAYRSIYEDQIKKWEKEN